MILINSNNNSNIVSKDVMKYGNDDLIIDRISIQH
jgi:hypothetical protein